jgi:hypothetical protein
MHVKLSITLLLLALVASPVIVGCSTKSEERLAVAKLESLAANARRAIDQEKVTDKKSAGGLDVAYDVSKTDSVTSPYVGTITVQGKDPRFVASGQITFYYAYQQGEWVFQKITARSQDHDGLQEATSTEYVAHTRDVSNSARWELILALIED